MSEEEDEDLELAPKPSKAPMIIGVVAGLALGAGGGFFAGTSSASPADVDPAELVQNESVVTLPIDDVIVDLRGGTHKLRLALEIHAKGLDQESLNAFEGPFRSVILRQTSDFSREDIDGGAGHIRLEETYTRRFSEIMGESGTIEHLYITQRVVQ